MHAQACKEVRPEAPANTIAHVLWQAASDLARGRGDRDLDPPYL
jgi:hypothetical protein